ncbi:MAG: hypothetical protein AMJ60_00020 [Desulfobacterales bacterium SG8_35]|nr:MAG: hypothetical protein AMJ60_00020 [Desulfobacterales bacterium SG8_35]
MSRNWGNTIYALLDQGGPFATADTPPGLSLFSPLSRHRASELRQKNLVTKYRATRNQIFELLNVNTYAEIQLLIKDRERRQEADRRAYLLLGNMFGINGSEREIISRVNSYSQTADSVIRYLNNKVLSRYSPFIEITNEIDIASSPVDLLLIMFDNRYHKKARFEAKRKLILMILAGSIDQRERETDIETKFAEFLHFLNKYVWSPDIKIGELKLFYLLSHHEPQNFSCRDVKVLSEAEAAKITPQQGQKLTLIKRRRFRVSSKEIPIYVSVRKKAPEAKVLKLIRKGEENPAVAVDDELGLLGVLDTAAEVKLFQKHLTESAIKAKSFMTLEDITDTLAGGSSHTSSNIGSSTSTPMMKFFARMGGMRVEFIVHTNKSYLDYIYKKDVSHDEYEVKRIFDSGVADLLFPREIYHLDMNAARNELIRWFRQRIENN